MGITIANPPTKASVPSGPPSFSQLSISLTILLTSVLTYLTFTPPNPNTAPAPSSGDWVRQYGFTGHALSTHLGPLLFLSLGIYTSALAYQYPRIPASLLRHGGTNGLNPALITWTWTSAVPLFCMLCIGIPLRLLSFSTLGHNFTFGLAEPDKLTTSGIYAYVQHPSYTGLIITVIAHAALTYRIDGGLSCIIPPWWFGACKRVERWVVPLWVALVMLMISKRVPEEEAMMKGTFGREWEVWHAQTARFIPGIF